MPDKNLIINLKDYTATPQVIINLAAEYLGSPLADIYGEDVLELEFEDFANIDNFEKVLNNCYGLKKGG